MTGQFLGGRYRDLQDDGEEMGRMGQTEGEQGRRKV